MTMDHTAVLFDLDGTLLDTLADIAHASNAAIATLGFPQHPVQAFRYFVGDGIEVLARRILPENHRSDSDVAASLAAINREFGAGLLVETRPYDGISELLSRLAHKSVKLAVVSNKPHEFVTRSVAANFESGLFSAVLGQRKNVPIKPDPTIALEAARLLSVADPGQCLYVGDSGVDMRTAVNAGMYPVGVLWGFRDADELLANGAKTLIKKPLELLDLLGDE
jgi:phosphoglycolate phosphatase